MRVGVDEFHKWTAKLGNQKHIFIAKIVLNSMICLICCHCNWVKHEHLFRTGFRDNLITFCPKGIHISGRFNFNCILSEFGIMLNIFLCNQCQGPYFFWLFSSRKPRALMKSSEGNRPKGRRFTSKKE